MRKLAALLIVAFIAQQAWQNLNVGDRIGIPSADTGGSAVAAAFERRQSDVQLRGHGEVIRILSDDNDGSRHQRFILGLDTGQTLLIAHNIDLAPRIGSLRVGDRIEFHGEYEWNSKGGVIHWTHHDPRGSHPDGWLKHDGRVYQ